jgi:D-alanine-D-alanine ligase
MISTALRRRPRFETGRPPHGALHVTVLMGGIGFERGVSLVSGKAVVNALGERGHKVTSIVLDSSDEAALDAIPRESDVVFLALHGEYGEDGTIQQSLARRGLTYTGSGPEASARAYDKVRAKRHYRRAGIPVGWQRVLEFPFDERSLRHAVRMTPDLPVVVKPTKCGSSVGVVICRTRDHLRRALEEGARYRQDLLIEEYVAGRELTCGVLDGIALPPVEATAQRPFFDYQAKYDKGTGTHYEVDPASLEAPVREEIRRLAVAAHQVLGCSDFSRSDFRYDPQRQRLIVLETNTIPGLTPTSLLPMAARSEGISFGALAERFCRLALRTHAE